MHSEHQHYLKTIHEMPAHKKKERSGREKASKKILGKQQGDGVNNSINMK